VKSERRGVNYTSLWYILKLPHANDAIGELQFLAGREASSVLVTDGMVCVPIPKRWQRADGRQRVSLFFPTSAQAHRILLILDEIRESCLLRH
jgi:hypothetical protein